MQQSTVIWSKGGGNPVSWAIPRKEPETKSLAGKSSERFRKHPKVQVSNKDDVRQTEADYCNRKRLLKVQRLQLVTILYRFQRYSARKAMLGLTASQSMASKNEQKKKHKQISRHQPNPHLLWSLKEQCCVGKAWSNVMIIRVITDHLSMSPLAFKYGQTWGMVWTSGPPRRLGNQLMMFKV